MIDCCSNKFISDSCTSVIQASSGNIVQEKSIVRVDEDSHSTKELCQKDTRFNKGMMVYARKDETHPWNNAIIQEVMAEGRIFIVKFVVLNEKKFMKKSKNARNGLNNILRKTFTLTS